MNFLPFYRLFARWRVLSTVLLRLCLGLGAVCAALAATAWVLTPQPAYGADEIFAERIDVERLQGQWLGKHLHICQQPDEVSWTPDQVITHCDWRKPEADIPGVGITKGVFWLALPLRFSSQPEQRWLLQLAYPILNQADFYLYRQGWLLASFYEREGGAVLHNRHFSLSLERMQGDLDVLVRVDASGSIQFPVMLVKETSFIAADTQETLVVGGAMGMMLAMLLYNFFIAVTSRNRAYFHYAGMVLGMLLVQLTIHGLGPRFLAGDRMFWNAQVLPVAIGLSIFFANAFCDEFLQLEAQQDPLRWGYRAVRWMALLLLGFTAFQQVEVITLSGVALVVFGSLYTLVLVVRHYTSNDRAIQFFCLGWFFFLLGVLLFSFNKLGVIPHTFWTEHLMLTGALIELLMLSLALGERINQERTQKELAQSRAISFERKEREAHAATLRHESLTRKAQEIALNLQKDNNALLERKVQERNQALEDLNERLLELTRQDPLTGVRNRRFLNERLPEEYARACRDGIPLSVVMVDVDHFKQINDQFGHLVGDDCLKAVANLLDRLVTGPGAVVTRYGGEEFCLLLPYTDAVAAQTLAETLCQAIADERWMLRGRMMRVTVSVGVASWVPTRTDKPERLLDGADKALYDAKKAGRNCVRVARDVGAYA